jgi:hypothetical protein
MQEIFDNRRSRQHQQRAVQMLRAKIDPPGTGDLFDQRFFFELLRLKGHNSGECSITLTTEYRIQETKHEGQRNKGAKRLSKKNGRC